jgi:hypothetical protein
VRGVGDEAALTVEGAVEPFQHGVEGVGEVFDLVVRPGERDAFVQAAIGDAARGRGDLLQRVQGPAGHEPSEPTGKQPNGGERDQRPDQHRAQGVVPVLLKLDAEIVVQALDILPAVRVGLIEQLGGELLDGVRPADHVLIK